MCGHNVLHEIQSQPDAFDFSRDVTAASKKLFEDARLVFFANADAFVAHGNENAFGIRAGAQSHRVGVAGILDGVIQ